MNKYIIINGIEIFFFNTNSLAEARNHAINVCNHSKEIIVREIYTSYKLNR